MFINKLHVMDFFELINGSSIDYVLIKNVGRELPDQLKDGKDIDIIVKDNQIDKFEKFMKSHNFSIVDHPLGRKNGWNFGYQLPEHQFWKKNNIEETLYIDVSFKLSCKSLSPKIWIPLDQQINKDIWENKVFDKKNGWWIMDDRTIFIYMIVRSVFDKNQFKDVYVNDIEKMSYLLNDIDVVRSMECVFFKYTNRLIDLLKEKRYDDIINDYICFVEY
ncbi:MAG: hypothetical protein E7249_17910 [Paenibacillaceae bacterium]|nr:hypothetical protein [Paenibacillaceae bacterium]